jgi:hypothetical protein
MPPQTAKPSPFTQYYMTVHLWKHQTYLRTLVQALFIFKIIVMHDSIVVSKKLFYKKVVEVGLKKYIFG